MRRYGAGRRGLRMPRRSGNGLLYATRAEAWAAIKAKVDAYTATTGGGVGAQGFELRLESGRDSAVAVHASTEGEAGTIANMWYVIASCAKVVSAFCAGQAVDDGFVPSFSTKITDLIPYYNTRALGAHRDVEFGHLVRFLAYLFDIGTPGAAFPTGPFDAAQWETFVEYVCDEYLATSADYTPGTNQKYHTSELSMLSVCIVEAVKAANPSAPVAETWAEFVAYCTAKWEVLQNTAPKSELWEGGISIYATSFQFLDMMAAAIIDRTILSDETISWLLADSTPDGETPLGAKPGEFDDAEVFFRGGMWGYRDWVFTVGTNGQYFAVNRVTGDRFAISIHTLASGGFGDPFVAWNLLVKGLLTDIEAWSALGTAPDTGTTIGLVQSRQKRLELRDAWLAQPAYLDSTSDVTTWTSALRGVVLTKQAGGTITYDATGGNGCGSIVIPAGAWLQTLKVNDVDNAYGNALIAALETTTATRLWVAVLGDNVSPYGYAMLSTISGYCEGWNRHTGINRARETTAPGFASPTVVAIASDVIQRPAEIPEMEVFRSAAKVSSADPAAGTYRASIGANDPQLLQSDGLARLTVNALSNGTQIGAGPLELTGLFHVAGNDFGATYAQQELVEMLGDVTAGLAAGSW